MSKWKNRSFTDKVKLRIKILWGILILMLVYMVVVGELGLGDSRFMTQLAEKVNRIIFFGGFLYVTILIIHNKKLLNDRVLLLKEERRKLDERQQFLHDKSGGIVVDILLLLLLFFTCTTALCNMTAFYTALSILLITITLKVVSYIIYNKIY